MPRDNHSPTEPNVLTFGPESARGESEPRTKIKQKNSAESKVVITTLFFVVELRTVFNLLSY